MYSLRVFQLVNFNVIIMVFDSIELCIVIFLIPLDQMFSLVLLLHKIALTLLSLCLRVLLIQVIDPFICSIGLHLDPFKQRIVVLMDHSNLRHLRQLFLFGLVLSILYNRYRNDTKNQCKSKQGNNRVHKFVLIAIEFFNTFNILLHAFLCVFAIINAA